VKICIIFNPAARGDKARRFHQHLRELAGAAELRPTPRAGAAQQLAAEAVAEGFDTIVAAGGDGTVNEVLNGIVAHPDGLSRVRLGVLPLGTVNVFAQQLRLPTRFKQAWQVICAGHERRIDLAEGELMLEGRPTRRCFVQMAGAGVDSRAIALVDWAWKKQLGPLAYWRSGFQALAEPKAPVTVSDGQRSLTGHQVLIGNGRYYGGRLPVFPEADLTDGLLEVTVVPRATLWALARGALGMLLGCLYSLGGAQHLRAGSLTLSSPSTVALQMDGENVGYLPARIWVRPQALRVVVPAR
jgi:YegS/Rv2252/BmrU family lipid kinase